MVEWAKTLTALAPSGTGFETNSGHGFMANIFCVIRS
jgi:hypothetical protein